MREIKFRAWEIDSKKMRHVVKIWWWNGRPSHISALLRGAQTEQGDNEKIMIRERFELMQFTGLKDKNGKEIYDGDIVKYDDDIWQIEWNNNTACFQLLLNDGIGLHPLFDNFHCEVIGNVYEHPNLLKA